MATLQSVHRISAGPRLAAGDLAALIRKGEPVRYDGATIEGDLDLDGAEVSHRLILHPRAFLGHVHLTEARFAHSVDFTGCEFHQGSTFSPPGWTASSSCHGCGSSRGGAHKPVEHNFDQIEVRGRLDGRQLHSEVPLSFRQARLGEVSFDGLRIVGDLNLEIARVSGDVFCQASKEERPAIQGSVRMSGLKVGGHMDLCGILVEGDLDLSNAEIHGDFLCQPVHGFRPEVLGAVSLFGARVGGQAGLQGLRVSREEEPRIGLNLGSAEIREDLRCSTKDGYRTEVLGPVSLAGAKIGGVAHFGGAKIGCTPSSDGCVHYLALHGAEIGRGLRVCPDGGFRPEIRGGVFATSARISHTLLFDRAVIEGDLDLQRAVVNGSLLCAFDEEFYAARPDASGRELPGHIEVHGSIDLSGAQVQELVLDGRVFDTQDSEPPSENPRARYRKHRREFFRRLLTGRQETGRRSPASSSTVRASRS